MYQTMNTEDKKLLIAMYLIKTKDNFIEGVLNGFSLNSNQAENLYLEIKTLILF